MYKAKRYYGLIFGKTFLGPSLVLSEDRLGPAFDIKGGWGKLWLHICVVKTKNGMAGSLYLFGKCLWLKPINYEGIDK